MLPQTKGFKYKFKFRTSEYKSTKSRTFESKLNLNPANFIILKSESESMEKIFESGIGFDCHIYSDLS